MSISRHAAESQVRSYSVTHPAGTVRLPTQPGWDRVLFSADGLFTAHTQRRSWTIPRHRGLCVSDGAAVDLRTTRPTAIRCLYLRSGLGAVGQGVRLVNLSSLSRELLDRAVAAGPMDLTGPGERALVELLSHQLAVESDAPLHLPMPRHGVARIVAARIEADPAGTLGQHLEGSHAHRRTVERRFRAETQMSLGQWRRRARVLAAVALLAEGRPVTEVALMVGYSSPSSFVVAFRSELDLPPRQFMAQ